MGHLISRLFVLPVALVAGSLLLLGVEPSPWALPNVVAFPLLMMGVIATHEGGHALAGLALGLEVPRISVGMGRVVRRWRWGRTTIQLNAIPFMGVTYLASARETGIRRRLWLAVAAGPLATLAVLGAVWRFPSPLTSEDTFLPMEAVATRPALRELAVLFSLLVLMGNLFPIALFRRGRGSNDGSELLLLPFRSVAQVREALITGALLEAEDLRERRDYDGAQRVLEEALQRVPGSWAVLNSLAIFALDRGRLAEARALFVDLLAREAPFSEYRWLARNNLAWVDFRLRDPELRAEADEHSAAVVAHFKNAPWAHGTRGAVLVWLGRFQEALRPLEHAYLLNTAPQNRAANACCLAWACSALGWGHDARRWLERARANDSRCALLADAESALEKFGSGSVPDP